MDRQLPSAKLTTKLKQRAAQLRKALKGVSTFSVGDAWRVLGGARATVGWTLWQLTDRGVITRRGRNQYSFQIASRGLAPHLSEDGQRVCALLQETGFGFLITGLDILSPYMLHVPEKFPVLVYTEKSSLGEVTDFLTRQGWVVILMPEGKRGRNTVKIPRQSAEPVWLYRTTELLYGHSGLADSERAFVDLYMAVTRHGYPLALQELARIFEAMQGRGVFNLGRRTKVASRRSIAEDVRFLRDYHRISQHAKKLAGYLEGGGKDCP